MIHSAAIDNQQLPVAFESSQTRARQASAGIMGSIWAPQPQPSGVTWPKTLDTLSRDVDNENEFQLTNGSRHAPIARFREDVFRTSPTGSQNISSKDVGAIGDGRKKNSPGYDDSHVEQLLRTLNLNTSTHFSKPTPLNLNTDSSPRSPDFSPASVSSALLTPTDLSPTGRHFDAKLHSPYEYVTSGHPYLSQTSLFLDNNSPVNVQDSLPSDLPGTQHSSSFISHHGRQYAVPQTQQLFEPFAETPTPTPAIPLHLSHSAALSNLSHPVYNSPVPPRRLDARLSSGMDWRLSPQAQLQSSQLDWHPAPERASHGYAFSGTGGVLTNDQPLRSSLGYQSHPTAQTFQSHEPINFLSLLHPSSSPPYAVFVSRIIKSSDQQASIFLQQKLKVADGDERAKIVDAICSRGFEMMAHRFGNWAVQRCLEAASTAAERRKIVSCMRGRVVDLATNCYGCHVLQKALDCEEDIRLLIVSELLLGDPAQTLVNKHASHVWSKIMELSWTPPAPPIFAFVNKSLKGKWASLACHETGSLVVQHAFENLEAEAKDGIVDELLNHGFAVFSEVAKSQWGSYCVQHILEHGSEEHRKMTCDHLLEGLLEFATNEQGAKSVTKALKEGGMETLDQVVRRMCEPARSARRAMVVDLALSVTGSQLIASVLPMADKDQRALLYECIRGHIVTLRGCKTGSKVIWLFDRMVSFISGSTTQPHHRLEQRAYYGY